MGPLVGHLEFLDGIVGPLDSHLKSLDSYLVFLDSHFGHMGCKQEHKCFQIGKKLMTHAVRDK